MLDSLYVWNAWFGKGVVPADTFFPHLKCSTFYNQTCIVAHDHEVQCHVKNMGHSLQGQGHS